MNRPGKTLYRIVQQDRKGMMKDAQQNLFCSILLQLEKNTHKQKNGIYFSDTIWSLMLDSYAIY